LNVTGASAPTTAAYAAHPETDVSQLRRQSQPRAPALLIPGVWVFPHPPLNAANDRDGAVHEFGHLCHPILPITQSVQRAEDFPEPFV